MIINNIDIISFGNFKDFHAELNENLNVIYGNVENGKVTITDFIKMMFYGASPIDRKSDAVSSERVRYRPSQTDKEMGGSIDFSFNDNDYRLHRIFRNSNSTDSVTLFNLTKNLEEKLPQDREVGKFLFGINKQSFKKSLFINPISVGLDNEKTNETLTNLIQTCDEDTSYTKVLEYLNATKENYLSKSGKVGILDKNKATLTSLYEDIEVAKQQENKKIEMQIDIEAVQENYNRTSKHYDELKKQLDIQHKMEEINTLKNIISKYDKISELNVEIEKRKKALTNDNITVDNTFINNAQQKMIALQQIGEHKNQMQSKVYTLKKEIETMKDSLLHSYQEEHKLHDEAVQQIEFTLGHIKNIEESIENKKKELSENSEKITNAEVDFRVADEQLKAKKEIGQQRIDMAQQQLTEASQSRVTEVPQNSAKSFIVLGIIIAILGLLVVLFAHNYLFLVMFGTGIFVSLASYIEKDNAIKKQQKYKRIDEVAISKATENIHNVRHEVELEQQFLIKKQRETKKQLNILKLTEEQINADIEKFQEQIKVLEKNLEYWKNQKKEMEDIFKAEQDKVDKKQSELDNILDDISSSEKKFTTSQNEIIQYINAFKPCNNLNEVAKAINSLNNDLNNIKDLENKIDYQQENIKAETNGQSYEVLKEKLSDITADFLEMCGKENPQPMSVSELANLKDELKSCKQLLDAQNKDLSYINSDIRANFKNSACISEIEHNINNLERVINKQEKLCHNIDLSLEVLNQSIEDMKQYSNKLNDKTLMIFNQLTKNTSYENSTVVQTFETLAQNDKSLEQWNYLSKGTMEQASMSLKLGIAQMMCENISIDALPILLDDTFIQYDDNSVLDGIKFLTDYSKNSQTIMFTAHKNVIDNITNNDITANLISMTN